MTAVALPHSLDSALTRGFAYFVFVDLLLLPYFPLFVMPYTLGIVVLWAVCRAEVFLDRDLRLFFILAIGVVVSTGFSFVYRSPDLLPENIKRAGQLLTSFSYYFFFRWLARKRKFDPKPLLMFFVVFHTAWSLWFLASPESAVNVAIRVYPAAAESAENNLMFRRFSYFFTDPNTNGYLISVVGLYLAQFGGMGSLGSAAVVGMICIGAVASGSRGVMVALALVTAIVVIRNRRRLPRLALQSVLALAVIAVVAIGAFRYWSSLHPVDTGVFLDTVKTARERLVGNEEESLSDVVLHADTSAGKSRLSIYQWEVTHLWPLPLGRGYQILADGVIFRPHSDFFRMIYSYGWVACGVILYFLFRDVGVLYFAVPAAMAFGINTLIDEQKLLVAFLALLALARVRSAGVNRGERKVPRQRTASLRSRGQIVNAPGFPEADVALPVAGEAIG